MQEMSTKKVKRSRETERFTTVASQGRPSDPSLTSKRDQRKLRERHVSAKQREPQGESRYLSAGL